ncbi:MAG: hypothetical protein JW864_04555 [Spirochaetes bacterium]|nr:hypothetical protein [Spirochaetota bacterium]
MKTRTKNLSNLVDARNTRAVFSTVREIFISHYNEKDFKELKDSYKKIKALFTGKYTGYNACNTRYHDLFHTMDVLLASARLLDGYNYTGAKMDVGLALNLLRASLFHDTGYIQEKWDSDGTGAKYTANHIGRSIAFLMKNMNNFSVSREDLDAISKMIRCTEIKTSLNTIPFSSEEEKTAGMILGSADILGQMSDREYLEKLLFLYNEMKEAGLPGYSTEFDIIKSTWKLYETIKKRLNNSFSKVYVYAEYHFTKRYDIFNNLYMESIERNIAYIEKIMNDTTTNFRHKLKRGKILDDHKILSLQTTG